MPWISILAGVAGGAANGLASQSHNQDTNQTPQWNGYTQAFMPEAVNSAYNWWTKSPKDMLFADLQPLQKQALDMYTQAGNNPALSNAAYGNITDTLSGKYLDPSSNPWLSNTFNMGADAVQNRVGSDFNAHGRFGGGLMYDSYQKNLNDLATQIYGGNYQQERQRQIQAASLAPQISALPFFNAAQLMNAGAFQQQNLQNKYDYPVTRINQFLGVAHNASAGPQVTSTTPYYTNPLNAALGFGMGTYALLNKNGGGSPDYGAGTGGAAAYGVSPDQYASYYGYK